MVRVPPSLTSPALVPTSVLRSAAGELEPTEEHAASEAAASRPAARVATRGYDMGSAFRDAGRSYKRMLYTKIWEESRPPCHKTDRSLRPSVRGARRRGQLARDGAAELGRT